MNTSLVVTQMPFVASNITMNLFHMTITITIAYQIDIGSFRNAHLVKKNDFKIERNFYRILINVSGDNDFYTIIHKIVLR